MITAEESQQRELEFWRTTPESSPDSIDNILNKVCEAQIFVEIFRRYRDFFVGASCILELGAGQAWASCLLKRLLPDVSRITATDLSADALQGISIWEYTWKAKPDAHYACKSSETNEPSNSVDVIFCFAAAHHFVEHDKTIAEIARILKPGGVALYLYEPTSPPWFYRAMYWRVNRKRPDCPEDVLVPKRIAESAKLAGLDIAFDYYPSTLKRGPIETVYYGILRAFPVLQNFLPCTANVIIRKS